MDNNFPIKNIENLVKKGVGLKSKLDEAKFLYNSAIGNLKYVNLNNDLEKYIEKNNYYDDQKKKSGLDNYFSDYLKDIITSKLDLDDVECLRIYANGQTAGQSGYPHTDDGHFTFLYFPNDWQIDWEGHLHFINRSGPEYEETQEWDDWNLDKNKLKTDEVVKTITYKPNRAVLFSANILHYAGAPHRLHVGLRTSLAYKFVKK